MKTKQPKPKVGCYIRVSTTNKKTTTDKTKPEYRQTYSSQKYSIRQWAKSAHVPESELVWYADRRSGSSMKGRDALARMLRHVDEGKLDCVVVYDLSRFSRPSDFAAAVKVLGDLSAKVRVVSIAEGIDFSTHIGILISQILLATYNYQRVSQNEKIRQGLLARKEQGFKLGRKRNEKRLAEIKKLSEKMGVTALSKHLNCSRANVYSLLSRAG